MTRAKRAAAILALAATLLGFDWTGRLGRLTADLADPQPAVRAAAVRELAAHPAADVADLVLSALEDVDASVRLDAAATAARLRLPGATPILLGWLDDEDEALRSAALEALGPLPGEPIVPALTRALADPRAIVRAAAVRGLMLRTDAPADVTRALISALDDADGTVRLAAVVALGERARLPGAGGDAESGLSAVLSRGADDAPEVRAAVATTLGALEDARGTTLLRRLATDTVAEVRAAAATALGRVRATDATEVLAAMARSDETVPAHAAIAALARVPGTAAFEALVDAGASGLSDAASTTADVAHLALVERLRLDGAAARGEITAALSRSDQLGRARWLASELALGIAPDLPDAAPALEALLAGERVPREVALLALGHAGGEVALARLLTLLDDAQARGTSVDAEVHGLTAYFEVAGPDGRATEPLASALGRAASIDTRAEICRLLGLTGSERAVPALIALLEVETGTRATLEALRAIARLAARAELGASEREAATAAAERALRDADADVRRAGRDALGAVGDDAALLRALAAVDGEPHLDRGLWLEAAARIHARVTPSRASRDALARTLRERAAGDDPELAAAALDAAALAGDEIALDVVLDRAAEDPGALFVLGRFAQPAALARLREALAEPGPAAAGRVALAAAALGEHGTPEDGARLLEHAAGLPWPASAAASFALARLARRGVLDASSVDGLCALAERRDPVVRANVAVALTALGATCDGVDLGAWTERPHAAIVRAAAIRWIAERPEGPRALAQCQDGLPPALVEAACAEPALPPLDGRTEVIAYELDGLTRAVHRWLALVLADGTVLVTRTDARARIVLDHAPAGPVVLEDPVHLPLER